MSEKLGGGTPFTREALERRDMSDMLNRLEVRTEAQQNTLNMMLAMLMSRQQGAPVMASSPYAHAPNGIQMPSGVYGAQNAPTNDPHNNPHNPGNLGNNPSSAASGSEKKPTPTVPQNPRNPKSEGEGTDTFKSALENVKAGSMGDLLDKAQLKQFEDSFKKDNPEGGSEAYKNALNGLKGIKEENYKRMEKAAFAGGAVMTAEELKKKDSFWAGLRNRVKLIGAWAGTIGLSSWASSGIVGAAANAGVVGGAGALTLGGIAVAPILLGIGSALVIGSSIRAMTHAWRERAQTVVDMRHLNRRAEKAAKRGDASFDAAKTLEGMQRRRRLRSKLMMYGSLIVGGGLAGWHAAAPESFNYHVGEPVSDAAHAVADTVHSGVETVDTHTEGLQNALFRTYDNILHNVGYDSNTFESNLMRHDLNDMTRELEYLANDYTLPPDAKIELNDAIQHHRAALEAHKYGDFEAADYSEQMVKDHLDAFDRVLNAGPEGLDDIGEHGPEPRGIEVPPPHSPDMDIPGSLKDVPVAEAPFDRSTPLDIPPVFNGHADIQPETCTFFNNHGKWKIEVGDFLDTKGDVGAAQELLKIMVDVAHSRGIEIPPDIFANPGTPQMISEIFDFPPGGPGGSAYAPGQTFDVGSYLNQPINQEQLARASTNLVNYFGGEDQFMQVVNTMRDGLTAHPPHDIAASVPAPTEVIPRVDAPIPQTPEHMPERTYVGPDHARIVDMPTHGEPGSMPSVVVQPPRSLDLSLNFDNVPPIPQVPSDSVLSVVPDAGVPTPTPTPGDTGQPFPERIQAVIDNAAPLTIDGQQINTVMWDKLTDAPIGRGMVTDGLYFNDVRGVNALGIDSMDKMYPYLFGNPNTPFATAYHGSGLDVVPPSQGEAVGHLARITSPESLLQHADWAHFNKTIVDAGGTASQGFNVGDRVRFDYWGDKNFVNTWLNNVKGDSKIVEMFGDRAHLETFANNMYSLFSGHTGKTS